MKTLDPIKKLAFSFWFSCLAVQMAHAQLKITEIWYDPPGGGNDEAFVEITNTGASTVNLTGYELEIGDDDGKTDFDFSGTLAPGQIIFVVETPTSG